MNLREQFRKLAGVDGLLGSLPPFTPRGRALDFCAGCAALPIFKE
jgi:tRNA1(Val) A37 N6-methylase TrmN6